MMKNIIAFIILFAASFSYAKDEMVIVAVVNGEAISNYDIKSRLDLLIKTTNMPESARPKLLPQVVKLLINEELKKQEAKKLSLKVTDEELNAAFDDLAKKNNVSQKDFKAFLKAQDISYSELREKIKAEILWSKLVQYRIRPLVKIKDEDIKNEIKLFDGETQFLVSKIVLPIAEYQGGEAEVKSVVENLAKNINSENFAEVAKEFSLMSTEPEWVSLDVLKGAEKDTVTEPIKLNSQYIIFNILDRRTLVEDSVAKADFKIKHLSVPLAEGADSKQRAKAEAKLKKASNRNNICRVDDSSGDIFEFTMDARLKDLSPQVADKIAQLEKGQKDTFYKDGNLYMVIVCNKKMPPRRTVTKDELEESVFNKKLNQEIINYMHKLNKEAIVEMKE